MKLKRLLPIAAALAALCVPSAASAANPTYRAKLTGPATAKTRQVVTYHLTVYNTTGHTLKLRAGLTAWLDPGTDRSDLELLPHVLKKHNNVPFSQVGGCSCLGKSWKFRLAANKRHTFYFQIQMVAQVSYILDANLADYTHPLRDWQELRPQRSRHIIKIVS